MVIYNIIKIENHFHIFEDMSITIQQIAIKNKNQY